MEAHRWVKASSPEEVTHLTLRSQLDMARRQDCHLGLSSGSTVSPAPCLLHGAIPLALSCGCCNKVPQAQGPHTTGTDSLTVLEARVQNQGVCRAMLHPKAPGEDPFWPSPASQVAPGIPWLVGTSLQSLLSGCFPMCLCLHLAFL